MSEHVIGRRDVLSGAVAIGLAGPALGAWSIPAAAAAAEPLAAGHPLAAADPGDPRYRVRKVVVPAGAFRAVSPGADADHSSGTLKTSTGGTFLAVATTEVSDIIGLAAQLVAAPSAGTIAGHVRGPFGSRTADVAWPAGATRSGPLGIDRSVFALGAVDLVAQLGPGTELAYVEVDLLSENRSFIRLPVPIRLYDTRANRSRLTTGESLGVSTRQLLPLSAHAFVNLTVTETIGAGYLTLDGPETSNLNWDGPNQTRANLAVTQAVGNFVGGMSIGAFGNGSAHVVVDLIGWTLA